MSSSKTSRYWERIKNLFGEDFSLGCAKSIEKCLRDDLHFDVVSLKMLSHGSHWISIPLKVDASAKGGQSNFFAKAVTKRGLRNFNYVVRSRNLRFHVLADQKGMLFQKARSPWEILRYEAETLKKFRLANIRAPSPLGLFQLDCCAFLLLEYLSGVPLGGAQVQQQNALDVLKIVRRLRDNRLVHGDIKLDNFVLTKWSELYLIDCLSCTRSLQQAFDYDLTGAIYSLSRRLHPADVLRIAALFFSASEIEAALGLIDIAGAQIDVLTEQDITKQIKLASESI